MAIALAGSVLAVNVDNGAFPMTTSAFTPATGELLVVKAVTEGTPTLNTPTATGGGITWTLRINDNTADKCSVYIWTGIVTSGGSSITVSVSGNGNGSAHWSMRLERWTGAELDATPAIVDSQGSGAPSASVTTEGNNSILTWCNGDWNANAPGTPAYRSSATAESFHDASTSFYVGYYAYQSTGTAGSKTVGMTAPTGQSWNMVGIELKETSTGITASPTAIASAEAFGTTVFTQVINAAPTAIASAEFFGTVAVSGAITLSPTGIASAEAIGTPSHNGLLTINPSSIVSGETFGTPTHSGAITLSPSSIASTEAFGTATYGESIIASPTSIAPSEAVGTPTVSGAITLSPTGIASAEAFGTAEFVTAFISNPVGISSQEAFGSVVVNLSIILSPSSITSLEAIGTPSVSYATVIAPTGIASQETMGTPVVSGTITLSPTGIASGEAFGTPTVVSVAVGIPSAEAFGTPTVTTSVTVSPTGIPSAEAFGLTRVSDGSAFVLDKPLSEYTYADLEFEYYSRQSGLAAGTINDHKVAFYKNLLGMAGHFDDLEYEYFKILSGLAGNYSLADHKKATIESTNPGDANDTLLSYYSQFFTS